MSADAVVTAFMRDVAHRADKMMAECGDAEAARTRVRALRDERDEEDKYWYLWNCVLKYLEDKHP